MISTKCGQRAAEALMTDTCTIASADAEVVYDAVADEYTAASGSVRYTGKCRVQASNVLDPRAFEVAGREVITQELTVSVPLEASTVVVGDVVTVTAAPHSPNLVGQQLTVTGVVSKSHATAHRLRCEAVT